MQANQPGVTSTEVAVLRAIRAQGLRPTRPHRVRLGASEVKPDLVFTRAKVAVFVNGCFWHACRLHASWPRRNRLWWRSKLAATASRDARSARALRRAGWSVITVWEHEHPQRGARRVRLKLQAQDQRR